METSLKRCFYITIYKKNDDFVSFFLLVGVRKEYYNNKSGLIDFDDLYNKDPYDKRIKWDNLLYNTAAIDIIKNVYDKDPYDKRINFRWLSENKNIFILKKPDLYSL